KRPSLVDGLNQVVGLEGCDLKVQHQRVSRRLDLRGRSLEHRPELVLSGIENCTGLAKFLELEDRLNLLGALRRLDQNEAQKFSPGERNLRMVGDLREDSLDVWVGGFGPRLAGCCDFPGDG